MLRPVPTFWQLQQKSLVHGWMPILFHLWDCAWTTTTFVSQLAFAQEHPFATPTPVTTVVCRLMALPRTASAANGVRAVTSAMLLSTTSSTARCLQPICLPGWNQLGSNGKCPNGVTLVPWRSGRLLVWDTTCPDTFAPSHLPSATREAGAVTALAERSKQEKYTALNQHHIFTLVTIETSGLFGPETFTFLRELGCCLKQVTVEAKSFSYLRRLSVAVQWGNTAAAMGSMGALPPLLISFLDCLFRFGALSASPLTACFSLICYIIIAKINNTIYLFNIIE